MMKCRYPTANTDLIPYIARALLVEESVLYSGVGKSWGTWAYQLDTAFIQSTVERTRGMIVQAREEVRAGIVAVIKNNDSLHEYLDEVANWEIPLYREVYAETAINLNPDRKQRLLLLRQRESLMILLSCLEARASLERFSTVPETT